MTGEGLPTITDADVRALAAKLKGLHALLTPPEQALLHTALRRAAGGEQATAPDTAGFAWAVSFNPFTYLDAIAGEDQQTARRDREDTADRPPTSRALRQNRSITMTNAQTSTLVVKTEAGDYFLVPWELVEQCRVPEEHKLEVDRLLAGSDDVSGYIVGATYTLFRVVNAVAGSIGAEVGDAAALRMWRGLGGWDPR